MDSKCTGRAVECVLVYILIITLIVCRMKRSKSSGIEDEFYGEGVEDLESEVKFSEVFGDRVCCSVRRFYLLPPVYPLMLCMPLM